MLTKIRISVSRDCEMNCVYCPNDSKIKMENYDGDNNYCMTNNEIIEILKVMKRFGLKDVHLTGGEPFRRKNLVNLISMITSLGMRVELNTNGVHLTSAKVKAIKKAGVKLLKISLDSSSRDGFLSFTGIDAFEKVVRGIGEAVPLIPVRLNCVVMQSNLNDVIPLLELCNKIKVPEIHLLDLTYYPFGEGKAFWEREFVYLTRELMPALEERFKSNFEEMPVYGCRFYQMPTSQRGTVAVIKEAEPTMRIEDCQFCENYCHEGVFTMRLSAGGYLNFCPCDNQFGVDALEMLKAGSFDEVVKKYSEVFDSVSVVNSFEEFVKKNNINYKRGDRCESLLSKL